LQKFKKSEDVQYVGKAQERPRIIGPSVVAQTHRSDPSVDRAIDGHGQPWRRQRLPAVLSEVLLVLSYNAKLYINGHEHLKRQLAKRGVRS